MQRLKTTEGRRVVVVVTDGRDENAASTAPGSVATWDMVIDAAQAMDATVYAIGLGSRVERGRLQQLADLTGGEAYFTDDLATLDAEYRRVVEISTAATCWATHPPTRSATAPGERSNCAARTASGSAAAAATMLPQE